MLHQLASLSVPSSVSVTLSGCPYARRDAVCIEDSHRHSYDVRSLPRLPGSADVDVAEVLSHFRLVMGSRAKAVAPRDDKFADDFAFEHLSLICDGPCLTLYQQLMSGRINWCTNVVNRECK